MFSSTPDTSFINYRGNGKRFDLPHDVADYHIPNTIHSKDFSNGQIKTNQNDVFNELYHSDGNSRNRIRINVPDKDADNDNLNGGDTFISVSDFED
jgi:hypothetical protein